MLKKLTLGVLGLMLVGGLLFGGKIIPYAKTAVQKVRSAAQDTVPVGYQIDAAKLQLEEIGPEIHNMVQQIAKEEVQVKRLAADLKQHKTMLEKSYDEMMTLRSHVDSGDRVYVDTRGQSHNTSRVKQDLRHRFSLYQTGEKTFEKKGEILEIRKESLLAAHAKLDEAKAQQRELEMQIENLMARNRMNEVIATASQINIDNSQLAKTRAMLDDIDARISADEEYLNIAPKYFGQIPVSTDSVISDKDIMDEMDEYFDAKLNDESDDDSTTIELNDDDLASR
jgi:chromosome segregation ATPase